MVCNCSPDLVDRMYFYEVPLYFTCVKKKKKKKIITEGTAVIYRHFTSAYRTVNSGVIMMQCHRMFMDYLYFQLSRAF